MNITVKTLPKSEVRLTIEVSAEKMKKYYEKAAEEISKMVKVPGFRPGHIPLEVLKKNVREEAIVGHMVDIALPEVYSEAIIKEKIQPVSRPRINILANDPLKFEATVAVYPEVKVSGYDKVKIKVQDAKVTPQDIEEVLKDVQKRNAKFKEVDRAAAMGDRVEVDFEGFDEGGAPLESTKSTNHPLILGDKSLVEGFEEELVGLKKGDKKSFKITFPKNYFHKKFQGKKVEFKVEIRRVEETEIPELTPEFIRQISGAEKTLDEVKKNIEENLLHEKQYREKVRRENEFLEEVIRHTKVDIPESLIEEEIDGMMDELKSEVENKGIPFEQFLEQSKKEIKDLRGERRREAEKRLTLRFGLQKIFEVENLGVTPEELAKEIEHVIHLYPEKERQKVRQEYKEGSYLLRRLENKLRMEKLFERFLA